MIENLQVLHQILQKVITQTSTSSFCTALMEYTQKDHMILDHSDHKPQISGITWQELEEF